MAKRRWTFVVVPDGTEAARRLQVSTRALKLIAGGAATLLLAAMVFGYVTVSHKLDMTRSAQLEQENALLAEELGRLHSQVTALNDTLGVIARRDSRYRVMANLDPIDPQVLQAGIGGPVEAGYNDGLTETSVLGRRAAEVQVDLNALIRRANLLASSFDEAVDSITAHTERLSATPSILPTQGWLSSGYKAMRMHPILNYARPHRGIDITAPKGTPILAPAGGVVKSTGYQSGFGNAVTISHGYGIVTKYAHADKILVKAGQRVKRGERIALVGKTGLATAPHLHYEVHVNGRPVDPRRFVLPEEVGG
jgi:murein DD-endopeptidase MepM/ murein hydrolase activator NlpD